MKKQKFTPSEQELAGRLESDVRFLAGEIGERNMHVPGTMKRAAGWIEERFEETGYKPGRHRYQIKGFHYTGRSADNVIAEVTGSKFPEKIVIVGAHYDSVYGSPGANDNASAVAVLLALAEWFRNHPPSATVRFVAFANEEPPFFHSRSMGSYAYAARCREYDENITAMIALDGLGFYSDEPGSQQYPVPGLQFFYPDTADFISFVTRIRDLKLLRRALNVFRKNASIQSEGAALPGFIPGVYWSDHWSFWKHGYSSFLVTDTLLYRDPAYHTPGDTPSRLDYERLARVTAGMRAVVENIASPGKQS